MPPMTDIPVPSILACEARQNWRAKYAIVKVIIVLGNICAIATHSNAIATHFISQSLSDEARRASPIKFWRAKRAIVKDKPSLS